jgi:hypothetical protein
MWVQRLYLVRALRSFDDFTYSMIRKGKQKLKKPEALVKVPR